MDGGKTWMEISAALQAATTIKIFGSIQMIPEHYSSGQRSRGADQRKQRTHMDHLVQPADRAAVSRRDQWLMSVSRMRGQQEVDRFAFRAAATTAKSRFAIGIPSA